MAIYCRSYLSNRAQCFSLVSSTVSGPREVQTRGGRKEEADYFRSYRNTKNGVLGISTAKRAYFCQETLTTLLVATCIRVPRLYGCWPGWSVCRPLKRCRLRLARGTRGLCIGIAPGPCDRGPKEFLGVVDTVELVTRGKQTLFYLEQCLLEFSHRYIGDIDLCHDHP